MSISKEIPNTGETYALYATSPLGLTTNDETRVNFYSNPTNYTPPIASRDAYGGAYAGKYELWFRQASNGTLYRSNSDSGMDYIFAFCI
jgi:hypothetical protein